MKRKFDLLCLLSKFAILLFLFTNLAGGMEIGVSPYEFEVRTLVNEKTCFNVELFSSSNNSSFLIEDRWSKKIYESREIKDYSFTSKNLQIKSEFESPIIVKEYSITVPVCISANKTGKYPGVIIFHSMESRASLGVWVELSVYELDANTQILSKTGIIIALISQGALIFVFLFIMSMRAVLLSKLVSK